MTESLTDQLALIHRHLDRATAAVATSGSPVARAVLGEFARKLDKAAAAMPGASAAAKRELIVEVEQAGDSAKVAADADTTMSADARKLVEIAHNAICVLKAQNPATAG